MSDLPQKRTQSIGALRFQGVAGRLPQRDERFRFARGETGGQAMSSKITSRKFTRRTILAGSALGAVTSSRLPTPAIAQNVPFKVGLLTVKTGTAICAGRNGA
jgi:hypothetical protein